MPQEKIKQIEDNIKAAQQYLSRLETHNHLAFEKRNLLFSISERLSRIQTIIEEVNNEH